MQSRGITDDLYIRHLVSISNLSSRLYDGLEKVLDLEEAPEKTAFLECLTQIEVWCDGAATRHDERLKFTAVLRVQSEKGAQA